MIAYPGEVTRFNATFDIAGLYVWHCHIVEHEDNEMMVPFCVGDQNANGCQVAGVADGHAVKTVGPSDRAERQVWAASGRPFFGCSFAFGSIWRQK